MRRREQGTSSRGITCVEFLKLDEALVSSSRAPPAAKPALLERRICGGAACRM